MTVADATLTVFTVFNSLRFLAYVPQIAKAIKDQSGAEAISFGTWSLSLLRTLRHWLTRLRIRGIGKIDEALSLTYCHCSNCRKLSGAHVASYVHVDADKFRLVAGEDLIQTFQSAPGSFRKFCRVCSSTVPGKAAYLATVSVPAGLLDDDPGVRPKLHVFVRSKVSWIEIDDGLPQHETWVPGYSPQTQR